MGSITDDNRVLAWYLDKSEISIWTLEGRQRIPFFCSERQHKMLESLQGEADLLYRDGNTLHSWSFIQLRIFTEYKAQLNSVPFVTVDPRNTSQTCPACGCVDKKTRPSQETFSCTSCGHSGLADYTASVNIRRRTKVN